MAKGDERCYSDYVPDKLPSQRLLLDKLEELGKEKGNSRILTTASVGVPVTIFLLVIREAIEALCKEQSELIASHYVIVGYSSSQVQEKFNLNINGMFPDIPQNTRWELSTPWTTAKTPAVSGCHMIETVYLLKPNPSPDFPLNVALSSPLSGVTAYKNVLRIENPASEKRPLINVFKPTFICLESFYALNERLEAEINAFCKVTKVTMARLSVPSTFDAMCRRRGNLTHDGNLAIFIEPETSIIYLGDDNLVDSMKAALEEACVFSESIYSSMLNFYR